MIRFLEERPDRAVHPVPAGQPDRVPGRPAAAGPVRRWRHVAREALGYAGPLAELRDELRARWTPRRRRASSSGRSRCSSSPRCSAGRRKSWPAWPPSEWVRLVRGDRGVLRRRAAAGLPPGLRAALLHPHARRAGPARAAAGARRRGPPGSRRSSASTSARSRSAGTWRKSPRTARRSARPGSSASRCTTAGRPTPTTSRSARSSFSPKHWVRGAVGERRPESIDRRSGGSAGRSAAASHQVHVGSRAFVARGAPAAGLGVLASVPAGRPDAVPAADGPAPPPGRASSSAPAGDAAAAGADRPDARPGRAAASGYTLDEMTDIAERVLRDIGLTRASPGWCSCSGTARQHEQPARVGPRLRGVRRGARRAERPGDRPDPQRPARPRAGLAAAGSPIPADTVFVGGLHNTCNEDVTFVDLDRVPDVAPGGVRARPARTCEEACDRNAHERGRRFESAPLTLTPRRRPAARGGPGRGPGPGAAGVGARDQRHLHRRPARADPRAVPRPPGVPHLLRPDPGRRRTRRS